MCIRDRPSSSSPSARRRLSSSSASASLCAASGSTPGTMRTDDKYCSIKTSPTFSVTSAGKRRRASDAATAICLPDRGDEVVVVRRVGAVSYTHLRAHETPEHLVCRLLLEKKKKKNKAQQTRPSQTYENNNERRIK
eukprot:TRINITY_DN30921_c0_g1_i2.p1 TRINITY_DN30921_c0_g1~~TRINITY_DN30921_c0_g1_i2.p1  ORF type:complete len:137 (-),score=25.68 TRINITY_DN30921_c0_g1_i2:24-434(-)